MAKQQITVPIFVPHLGCPHTCSFCDQHAASGMRTVPDEKHVHTEVEKYLSRKSPSVTHIEIAFFGGSFTAISPLLQEELLQAAHRYLKIGAIQGIRLSTRPDCLDEARLGLLKKYGVTTIEIGAQSFDDAVLVNTHRGHTADDIEKGAKLIKASGFSLVIQLMTGLPGDDGRASILSAERAAGLAPNGARIYPALVLKNTPLEELYREGKYAPLTLESAVETCSRMYAIFTDHGVPVIRMGLHPFNEEEASNIIAGPYQPSFGLFAKARYRRKELEGAIALHLKGHRDMKTITVTLPLKHREEYVGHKKGNICYLEKAFCHIRINWIFKECEGVSISH